MGQTWGHNGPTDRAFFGHLGAETLTHAIPYTKIGARMDQQWLNPKVMTIRCDKNTCNSTKPGFINPGFFHDKC